MFGRAVMFASFNVLLKFMAPLNGKCTKILHENPTKTDSTFFCVAPMTPLNEEEICKSVQRCSCTSHH